MENSELIKIVEFIQGAYNRTLNPSEIRLLKEELQGYDYEEFIRSLKYPLLKKVDYFTIQGLHKIVEDDKDLRHLRDSLGIKGFEELYEN